MTCLSKAVARWETGTCTLGSGRSHNNCFGIKRNSKFVSYSKTEHSYHDFVDVWTRLYGGRIPTLADACRYSGNHNCYNWHRNVLIYYYQCTK